MLRSKTQNSTLGHSCFTRIKGSVTHFSQYAPYTTFPPVLLMCLACQGTDPWLLLKYFINFSLDPTVSFEQLLLPSLCTGCHAEPSASTISRQLPGFVVPLEFSES